MKKHIPNFITCLNLFSGCLAIYAAFNNDLLNSFYFIIIAAVFDFLDGLAARLLNVKSELGKQLDSLGDIVSFGVAPACIMFMLIKSASSVSDFILSTNYLPFLAFIIVVFSGLRLAKFNIDENQTDSFIGLPTPANAIFIGSLPFVMIHNNFAWLANPFCLAIVTLILSYLLVSPLPLFALKFHNLSWKENQYRFFLIIISIILLILLTYSAIPLIIIVYILLSLMENLFSKKNKI